VIRMGRFAFLALLGLGTALAILVWRPPPSAPRFEHDGSLRSVPIVAASGSFLLDGAVARAVTSDGSNGLFVGTRTGRLFALDPGPKLRWVRDLPAGVDAPMALDADGGVTLGTLDGAVQSWTRAGELRWTTRLPAPVRGGVTKATGSERTFVAAGRRIWALDGEGGRAWSFEASEEIRSQPVSFDNRVYVGARDDHVYALDGQTGTEVWRFRGGADFDVGPAIGSSGDLYLAGDDGFLRALSADGALRWELPLAAPARAPIGVTRNGELLLRTGGAAPELWRVGPNGQRRWSTRLALTDVPDRMGAASAVELPSGQIAVVSVNQELLVLDAEGRPRFRVPLESAVSAPLVIGGNALYVVTQAGAVRALRF
jgi:outer membrane protein assembly factor BamB